MLSFNLAPTCLFCALSLERYSFFKSTSLKTSTVLCNSSPEPPTCHVLLFSGNLYFAMTFQTASKPTATHHTLYAAMAVTRGQPRAFLWIQENSAGDWPTFLNTRFCAITTSDALVTTSFLLLLVRHLLLLAMHLFAENNSFHLDNSQAWKCRRAPCQVCTKSFKPE